MTDFRAVTDTFAVSPQITLEDLDAAKAQGFTLIINNRPDGEAAGQLSSAEVEAQARRLGLDYLHAPVTGQPDSDQIASVTAALKSAKGPVLAYCRSGTRSIITWSLGQLKAGNLTKHSLMELARGAGYEIASALD